MEILRILSIGDIVGKCGCEFLRSKLPTLKSKKEINLVIANGENSAEGNGITPYSAKYLFNSGVDVITTGNHAFRRKEMYSMFEENEFIVRPANYPERTTPGKGIINVDLGFTNVDVINLQGTVYLQSLDCPFETADKLISKSSAKVKIIDFHAEATAEKRALCYYLDGKVSAIFGTHTHIQTADEQIFKNGTGYITDVGMTGAIDSVLGVKPKLAVDKLVMKIPIRFENAVGAARMDCIIFGIDENTGKCLSVERLQIL